MKATPGVLLWRMRSIVHVVNFFKFYFLLPPIKIHQAHTAGHPRWENPTKEVSMISHTHSCIIFTTSCFIKSVFLLLFTFVLSLASGA